VQGKLGVVTQVFQVTMSGHPPTKCPVQLSPSITLWCHFRTRTYINGHWH